MENSKIDLKLTEKSKNQIDSVIKLVKLEAK